MNIVYVMLNNFQDYILDNIEHSLSVMNPISRIFVITNKEFFPLFHIFLNKITLVASDDLSISHTYNKTSVYLKDTFRNGFWHLTSLRFFYIYEFMKKYEIESVLHLENDVLIYYSPDILIPACNPTYVYMPFDCWNRNIASIVYIPNHVVFGNILQHYDHTQTDMANFSVIREKTGLIETFPIFPLLNTIPASDEIRFVSKNFDTFGCIFDAAAIGQYLFGVDPRNIQGDTRGFINETCVIKYNNYQIVWQQLRPFLCIEGYCIPIFNLHIHCKNLKLH